MASGILLVAPVFTGQRASLLGMVFGIALIVVWPLVSKRHRVLHVTGRDKVAIGLTVLAIAGIYSLAAGTGHGYNFGNSSVATSFTSAGKADSAQSRLNQWGGARKLIAVHPWLGWGLGKHFVRYEKIEDAPLIESDNDLSHDIFLDVLLRTGIVGLSFLVLALGSSIAVGLRAARRHSPRIVALGLAASGVIVGMMVRGAVESIFEKERLAVLLGLAVGIACSAGRVRRDATGRSSRPAQLTVPADWSQVHSVGGPLLVGTGSVRRNDN